MSKVKILQNINGWVGGAVVPLREGQEVEPDKFVDNELENLIRGGYAEHIKPAVKVTKRKPARKKAAVKVVKDGDK